MSFFSFDLFNFPGIACVMRGLSYMEKHQIFTLVPTGVVVLLAVPSATMAILIRMGKLQPEPQVVQDTIASFFFFTLSFLFLIYPTVSATVLNTFNCADLEDHGRWLKVDMREPCPADQQGALQYIWSIVMILVFPIGEPLAFAAVLWYYKVQKLSHQKREYYHLKAVLNQIGFSHFPDGRFVFTAIEKWSWAHLHPICLLNRRQTLCILRYDFGNLEDVAGAADGITSRIFRGKGLRKFEEATEAANNNLAQAAASVEEEATVRGLLETDASGGLSLPPLSKPPGSPPALGLPPDTSSRVSLETDSAFMPPSSKPEVSDASQVQTAMVSSRGLSDADAPSVFQHRRTEAGADAEAGSGKPRLLSSLSPRVKQSASTLRSITSAGAAGGRNVSGETVHGSNFGAASTIGATSVTAGASLDGASHQDPAPHTSTLNLAPAEIGLHLDPPYVYFYFYSFGIWT